MEIRLEHLSKRYSNKEWIFKDLSYTFETGERIAIIGNNGSGKSTLLRTIGGMSLPSSGHVHYLDKDTSIHEDELIRHITFASPYLELIEDFTLMEMLSFHFKFKPIRKQISHKELIRLMYFEGHENKLIKNFSSGMKQRLKLALAFHTEASVVLLDEPGSNLDQTGFNWYLQQLNALPSQTITIIASNQKEEYQSCNRIIDLSVPLGK
ncbi:ABC transporter ATP-binding protein [Reichenbachiella agariperforans]|uniref:ABC transporter ATP-binding protein n=1 Tax=Reichenbachiella agariperforans TaxID=156994 RepID=UPI001C09E7AE|nr:ABC transporter ATP-binding protein [Reichenbachiella agariperforans]MBU2914351.1 ABC transporter ATP-binding protein [Reichenbachiella agariperforans]